MRLVPLVQKGYSGKSRFSFILGIIHAAFPYGTAAAVMIPPLPYAYLVQRGLERILQDHGMIFPEAIVIVTRGLPTPDSTYHVRVNSSAKLVLSKCLEDSLRRPFPSDHERWSLGMKEAQVLAGIGGWQPDPL
jgi:hypothetical protein